MFLINGGCDLMETYVIYEQNNNFVSDGEIQYVSSK